MHLTHRGRPIAPVCGGEDVGNVIVLIGDGVRSPVLVEESYYTEVPTDPQHMGRFYSVRIDPVAAPKFYEAVADDAVYLYAGPHGTAFHRVSRNSVRPQQTDRATYKVRYWVLGRGLVVVVVAPIGATLSRYCPDPVAAKVGSSGRLLCMWVFKNVESAEIEFGFDRLSTSAEDAVRRIVSVSSTAYGIREKRTSRDDSLISLAELQQLILFNYVGGNQTVDSSIRIDNSTVNAPVTHTVLAQEIQDSFKSFVGSPVGQQPDLQQAMKTLHDDVADLIKQMGEQHVDDPAPIANYLKSLTTQASETKPDPDLLGLSGKKLIDAVKGVAVKGAAFAAKVAPIVTAVSTVMKFFGVPLPV